MRIKRPLKSQVSPVMYAWVHISYLLSSNPYLFELSTKSYEVGALAASKQLLECNRLLVVRSGRIRSTTFLIKSEASEQFWITSVIFRNQKMWILCPSGSICKWLYKRRCISWNGNLTRNADFPSLDGIESSFFTATLQKLYLSWQYHRSIQIHPKSTITILGWYLVKTKVYN